MKLTSQQRNSLPDSVIGQVVCQQDHHPDLPVSDNRCKVSHSTHSVNGLSIKDFNYATKINTAQIFGSRKLLLMSICPGKNG